MIRLRSVQKAFDRPVLSNVSLDVPDGSLTGLIGPGAARQSLVLKTILGLVVPDAGAVEVARA